MNHRSDEDRVFFFSFFRSVETPYENEAAVREVPTHVASKAGQSVFAISGASQVSHEFGKG